MTTTGPPAHKKESARPRPGKRAQPKLLGRSYSPPRGNANLAYLQLLAENYGSGLLTVLRMRDANARSSWLERISTTTMREVCVSDLYQLLPILKRLHLSPSPFDESWVVGEGLPWMRTPQFSGNGSFVSAISKTNRTPNFVGTSLSSTQGHTAGHKDRPRSSPTRRAK